MNGRSERPGTASGWNGVILGGVETFGSATRYTK
jgi:hypothetical protein